MRRTLFMLGLTLAIGVALGAIGGQGLNAQQAPVKGSELLKADMAGVDGKELVVRLADIAPGAAGGRHYHVGHEVFYVLEGSGILEVEGKSPVPLKPGNAVYMPPKQVHEGKNTSTTDRLKVLVFVVHEKGQPAAVRLTEPRLLK